MSGKYYKAFLSYSRKDEKFAKKIHTKIENYVIPKELYKEYSNLPKNLSPIFRDIEELSSGNKLPKEILRKLKNSENLIVICSPNSAKSPWVNKEIIDFKVMFGEDKIFPIIIDGEPFSEDNEKECFTKALKYKVDSKGNITNIKTNILASNIIKSSDGEVFARIKLIAGILGVENDELWKREEKRRHKKLLYIGVFLTLFVLFLIGVSFFSIDQKNKAVKARGEAENLISFMTFDLREKLEPIGRLDILDNVQKEISSYYGKLDIGEKNPKILRQRAINYSHQGDIYKAQGKLDNALKEYENFLKLLEVLLGIDPNNKEWLSDLIVSHDRIGNIYEKKGKLNKSLNEYKKSLKIVEILLKNDPHNIIWLRDLSVNYSNLGNIYETKNELKKALLNYKKSLKIIKNILEKDKKNTVLLRDLSVHHESIGGIYKFQGNLKSALEENIKSLKIRKKLSDSNPSNTGWLYDLTVSYEKLGDIYIEKGDSNEALNEYNKHLNISKKISKFDPSNIEWLHNLTISYDRIADIYKSKYKLTEALINYKYSLKIVKSILNISPNNIEIISDLAVSYDNLGYIYQLQDELEKALDVYKKSLEIREKFLRSDPDNTSFNSQVTISYDNIGYIYQLQNKLDESLYLYEKSREIRKIIFKINPSNDSFNYDLAKSYNRIGDIFRLRKQHVSAINSYKNALNITEPLSKKLSDMVLLKIDKIEHYYKLYSLLKKENYREKADFLLKKLISNSLLSIEEKRYITNVKLELGIRDIIDFGRGGQDEME